jgi:NhaA family Na+:H+ antiporter
LLLLAVADDFFSLLIFGSIYGSKLHLADSLSTLGAALLGFALGQIKILQPARLIQILNPLTTFFIVPVYVIYQVRSGFSTEITNGTTLGFLAARVIGKVLGIALFIWVAHRMQWIDGRKGVTLAEAIGVGVLAGAAMTVSLVIGEIAAQSPGEMDQLRSGVFLSAIISVILGSVWLRLRGRVHASE